MGTESLESILQEQRDLAKQNGEPFHAAEIRFACVECNHVEMHVAYEDGLVSLLCSQCGDLKGQIEVAKKGRALPLEYVN